MRETMSRREKNTYSTHSSPGALYKKTGAQESLKIFQEEINQKLRKRMEEKQKKKNSKLPKLTLKFDASKENKPIDPYQAIVQQRYKSRLQKLGLTTFIQDRSDQDHYGRPNYQNGRPTYFNPNYHHDYYSYQLPIPTPDQFRSMIAQYFYRQFFTRPSQNHKYPLEQSKKIEQQYKTFQKSQAINPNRKQALRKRLRVIMLAVYFSIIFPKFAMTVKNLKYQAFKKMDRLDQIQAVQEETFQEIYQMDLFDLYTKNKEIAKKEEQEGQPKEEIIVTQNKILFEANIPTMCALVEDVVDKLLGMARKGKLKPIYYILAGFYPGEYPFNGTLLQQELSIMQFDTDGRVRGKRQNAQLLLLNYLVVKKIIYPILHKKLLKLMRATAAKKLKNKKLVVLDGRCIKIAFVLFYSMANQIYKQNTHKVKFNYDSVKKHLRTRPMDSLQYNFSLDKTHSGTSQSDLIQGIVTNPGMLKLFSRGYDSVWQKLVTIGELLSSQVRQFQINRLQQFKEEALSFSLHQQPLPYSIHRERDQTEEQSESDGENDGLAAELLIKTIDNVMIQRKKSSKAKRK